MDNVVPFISSVPESECPCCALREDLLGMIVESGLPIDVLVNVINMVKSDMFEVVGADNENGPDDAA